MLRMRHLVARLLECQILVMEPFIAGPLQALDRLQRCLNRQGLDAFEHLLGYQTISFQSTEAYATDGLRIAEVAGRIDTVSQWGPGTVPAAWHRNGHSAGSRTAAHCRA